MGQGPCFNMSSFPGGSDSSDHHHCRLRIIHFSDVYLLTDLPYIATIIQQYKVNCNRLLVTCGGDFLAPSVLSSLDNGRGMVSVLRAVGVTHVCFGNHEADVPDKALMERIKEMIKPFEDRRIVWINSNMLGYKGVELPTEVEEEVVSKDGKHKRKIIFLGLLCHTPSLYRPSSFDCSVSSLTPVNPTSLEYNARLSPKCDLVIPLTHQLIADDRELAQTAVFPLILGGHDHEEFYEKHNNSLIIKCGLNGRKVVVIDLLWESPLVKVPKISYVTVGTRDNDRKPDPNVMQKVKKKMLFVGAMSQAVIYRAPSPLSSKNSRCHPTSIGTLFCTLLRNALHTDGVMLDAGCIRADADYPLGRLTLSNIKEELPFDTDLVIVQLPGQVISDGLKFSRRMESTRTPNGGYFQVDDKIIVDKTNNITSINGNPIVLDQTYYMALLYVTIVEGMNDNEPINNWFTTHPKPGHEGRHQAKPLILNGFCRNLWRKLPGFDEIDTNKNGKLSRDEIYDAYVKVFDIDINVDGVISEGEKRAAELVVEQLIEACDMDNNKCIDRLEYERFLDSVS